MKTPADRLVALHDETDRRFADSVAALESGTGARVGCRAGCCACCVDGLTVWRPEADRIAAWVREHGPVQPHPDGACAFLDAAGRCQVFPARPYVCRSQGAVLRWEEDDTDAEADDFDAFDDADDLDGFDASPDSDAHDGDAHDRSLEAAHEPAAVAQRERRATCSEHLHGVALDALPEEATFELGPAEDALLAIATDALSLSARSGLPERVSLRTLAEHLARG